MGEMGITGMSFCYFSDDLKCVSLCSECCPKVPLFRLLSRSDVSSPLVRKTQYVRQKTQSNMGMT